MSSKRGKQQWTPPSESMRRYALGKVQGPETLVAATQSCSGAGGTGCGTHAACFQPKTPPKASDWLADGMPGEHERGGQTFSAFSRIKARMPSRNQKIIRLCNIDADPTNDSASQQRVMTLLSQFLSIYFSMPCEVMKPLTETERKKLRTRSNVVLIPQLQTGPIHSILYRRLKNHKDTFAVVGVTLMDLYPNQNWNFVFGEASPSKGVGVFSFARYTKWFNKACSARVSGIPMEQIPSLGWNDLLIHDTRALRRALHTLAHETGHLFHLNHCVYYQCVMNGANSLEEGDKSPLHLCPVCLRKWFRIVSKTTTSGAQQENSDLILSRYNQLAVFLSECGLESESQWYRQAVMRCCAYLKVGEGCIPIPMDID